MAISGGLAANTRILKAPNHEKYEPSNRHDRGNRPGSGSHQMVRVLGDANRLCPALRDEHAQDVPKEHEDNTHVEERGAPPQDLRLMQLG